MEAANEVIWSIKGISACLVQTYGPERPSMTLLEFLPHFTPCSDRGGKGGGGSKTNVARLRNCPYRHILTLFPEIAHNEQLIIVRLWLPQHTAGK